ncbi:MAG: TetR/AcrR family transcriptional regulator [Actinomycetota bacterium]
MTDTNEAPRIDGRTARRERGRQAVIDAAFRLLDSGEPATTDRLAREAGTSTSSLYRYFDDMADLYQQAAAHFHLQHADLIDAAPEPDRSRIERTTEFVGLRIRCTDVLWPWAQRLEAQSLTNPDLKPFTLQLRSRVTEQVDRYFRPELDELSPAKRADLRATLDVATSSAIVWVMRDIHRRSPNQIKRAWRSTIATLLAANDPDEEATTWRTEPSGPTTAARRDARA